jgi:hypothetical protein
MLTQALKLIATRKIPKVSGMAKSTRTRLSVKVRDPEKRIARAQDQGLMAEGTIVIQIQMAKSTH